MYERFTDRARKVMQLANQEAQRFNHEYIGTEHILLGLVKEGSGVAANVLKNLDIDLRKIRLEVEKIVQCGPDKVTLGKMPQTPRAKKVLEYAIEEARNLKHNYVGTEHVLLGILREEEGVAALILGNLGLKLEDVREEVLNLVGHNTDPRTCNDGRKLAEKLQQAPGARTAAAYQVLEQKVLAAEEVSRQLAAQVKQLEGRLASQLGNVRLVLGGLVGTSAGVLIGGAYGSLPGLLIGGLVAALGRPLLGALAAALPGALIGSAFLIGERGSIIGGLVGIALGACIADIGRQPGRRLLFGCCGRRHVEPGN